MQRLSMSSTTRMLATCWESGVAVCCSVLQRVAACCSVLQYVIDDPHAGYVLEIRCCTLCCSVLQRVAACCSVLQRVAVCHRRPTLWLCAGNPVLQCVAMCCSVLQRAAACCSVLQYVIDNLHCGYMRGIRCCSVLQRVAACCSVLQRIAACCSVLQRVAACCSMSLTTRILTPCWESGVAVC